MSNRPSNQLPKIESLEPMILMSASAMEIEGTEAGEWISGTAADDIINAGGGNDEIYAPLGNNIIDGGDGHDSLVIYEGVRDDYTVSIDASGNCIIEGPGANGETVRNVIKNVEQVIFNDGWLSVDDLKDGAPTDTDDPTDPDEPSDKSGSNNSNKSGSSIKSNKSGSNKSGSNKSGSNKSGSNKSGSEMTHPGSGDGNPPTGGKTYVSTEMGESVGGYLLDPAYGGASDLWLDVRSWPENGYILLTADGEYDYVPYYGFTGEDSFEYAVMKGHEVVGTGEVCVTIGDSGSGGVDPDPDDDDPSGKSGSNKSNKSGSSKKSNKSGSDKSNKSGSSKKSNKSGSGKSNKSGSSKKSGSNKSNESGHLSVTPPVTHPPSGYGEATIVGTDVGEWITGISGADVIQAKGGNDEIYAPTGHNVIDGGGGMDSLVIYEGNRADYTLSYDGYGNCVIEGPGADGHPVRNVLISIEKIIFNDGWVFVDDVKPEAPGTPEEPEPEEPSGSDKSDKSGSSKKSNKSGSDKSDKSGSSKKSNKSGSDKSDKSGSSKKSNKSGSDKSDKSGSSKKSNKSGSDKSDKSGSSKKSNKSGSDKSD